MRVIAGKYRSIPLKTPEGDHTRPTQDRIKETLFNMLQPNLPGAVFLDLFSGSGGIGIEAVSRGAKRSYLVEMDRNALACIHENVKKCRCEDECEIVAQDVFSFLRNGRIHHADIVFMDPPYRKDFEREVLASLVKENLVDENSLVIVEAALDSDLSYVDELGFEIEREKCYKTNKHLFLRRRVN